MNTDFELLKHQDEFIFSSEKFPCLDGGYGNGKDCNIETPVPTTEGFKKHGELQPFDEIYDEQGNIQHVIAAGPVQHNTCYRVHFSDGSTIECGENHLWYTEQRRFSPRLEGKVRETREIKETLRYPNKNRPDENNHRIPVVDGAIEGIDRPLPIDPYLLGLWLGDGNKNNNRITIGQENCEIIEVLRDKGVDCEVRPDDGCYRVWVENTGSRAGSKIGDFNRLIRNHDLCNNKHIPWQYLRSTEEQRRELLCGLMDSDGYSRKGSSFCAFYNTNKSMCEDVKELLCSLGYKATISKIDKESDKHADQYEVRFYAYDDELVFRLDHKAKHLAERPDGNNSAYNRMITDIEPIDTVPTNCISVSGESGLYLAGKSMIPTHNSTAWQIRLALHCQNNPGTKTGVFRQDLSDLKKSTKQEWEQFFGNFGNYHENDNIFTFNNGSTVLFHQLTDTEKLRNHNFSAFVIEQAEETNEEAFFTLMGRLRRTDTDNSNLGIRDRWGAIATNPEGHDWVWKNWIKGNVPEPDKDAVEELKEIGLEPPSENDFHYICAESFSNKENLPDDYLQTLMNMPEHMRKKYVHASRDVLEGAIYSMLEPQTHLIEPFEIPKEWPKWTTLDYGDTNPTACLWLTMDYNHNIYVYREHYKKKGDNGKQWIVSQHVQAIKDPEQNKNNRVCPYVEDIRGRYIDPGCTAKTREKNGQKISIMEEFSDEGLMGLSPWRRANKKTETQAQINRVAESFQPKPDQEFPNQHGRSGESPAPKLYFFNTCQNAWEEHRQWEWKKQSKRKQGKKNLPDVPQDHNDHSCDALRGWVAEKMIGPSEEMVAPPGSFDYIRQKHIAKKRRKSRKNKTYGQFNL